MSAISDAVSVNSDGTVTLADGRVVRMVAGRGNMFGYRELDDQARAAQGSQPGVDQIGKTPVPSLSNLGLDQL
jgi:hypothetical protein